METKEILQILRQTSKSFFRKTNRTGLDWYKGYKTKLNKFSIIIPKLHNRDHVYNNEPIIKLDFWEVYDKEIPVKMLSLLSALSELMSVQIITRNKIQIEGTLQTIQIVGYRIDVKWCSAFLCHFLGNLENYQQLLVKENVKQNLKKRRAGRIGNTSARKLARDTIDTIITETTITLNEFTSQLPRNLLSRKYEAIYYYTLNKVSLNHSKIIEHTKKPTLGPAKNPKKSWHNKKVVNTWQNLIKY